MKTSGFWVNPKGRWGGQGGGGVESRGERKVKKGDVPRLEM